MVVFSGADFHSFAGNKFLVVVEPFQRVQNMRKFDSDLDLVEHVDVGVFEWLNEFDDSCTDVKSGRGLVTLAHTLVHTGVRVFDVFNFELSLSALNDLSVFGAVFELFAVFEPLNLDVLFVDFAFKSHKLGFRFGLKINQSVDKLVRFSAYRKTSRSVSSVALELELAGIGFTYVSDFKGVNVLSDRDFSEFRSFEFDTSQKPFSWKIWFVESDLEGGVFAWEARGGFEAALDADVQVFNGEFR